MFEYTYVLAVSADYLAKFLKQQGVYSSFADSLYVKDAGEITIVKKLELTEEEETALGAVIAAYPAARPRFVVEASLEQAVQLGQKMIIEFATGNVLLGITAANKTRDVRIATAAVISALQTGSLYDAMAECRLIPAAAKDLVFVTDARLLEFINKIETYLGITLSSAV